MKTFPMFNAFDFDAARSCPLLSVLWVQWKTADMPFVIVKSAQYLLGGPWKSINQNIRGSKECRGFLSQMIEVYKVCRGVIMLINGENVSFSESNDAAS